MDQGGWLKSVLAALPLEVAFGDRAQLRVNNPRGSIQGRAVSFPPSRQQLGYVALWLFQQHLSLREKNLEIFPLVLNGG